MKAKKLAAFLLQHPEATVFVPVAVGEASETVSLADVETYPMEGLGDDAGTWPVIRLGRLRSQRRAEERPVLTTDRLAAAGRAAQSAAELMKLAHQALGESLAPSLAEFYADAAEEAAIDVLDYLAGRKNP